MTAFLITYDLRKQRNYEPLIEQLRKWNCISPLESVWLGNFDAGAGDIRDALSKLIDGDDGLLVIELVSGANWGTQNVGENAAAWLTQNVTSYR